VVTEAEFEWMQQRLRENQLLAPKNTKLRSYLLKGMIRCAACGRRYNGVTMTRRGKDYSYYVCGARWKQQRGELCGSRTFRVDAFEEAVFATLVGFLQGPEGFQSEMLRRKGITDETAASLRRELVELERQAREEEDAEAKAFRLASRSKVSEEIFSQELGLIRTRQRWISEQHGRVEAQLADVERFSFTPEVITLLRQRLDSRLAGTTAEDKRFVLDAVGTNVLVQADGTWELELQVPRQEPAPPSGLQVVSDRPESNSAVNTAWRCW
jgi:site-specific DNA recombinase